MTCWPIEPLDRPRRTHQRRSQVINEIRLTAHVLQKADLIGPQIVEIEPPRHVWRLHLSGGLESCQVALNRIAKDVGVHHSAVKRILHGAAYGELAAVS
jgi:hypothetical protein